MCKISDQELLKLMSTHVLMLFFKIWYFSSVQFFFDVMRSSEICQKFWASKAAFGGIQLSIFSKINRYSANGGLFLSKAYLTREYEPNWFFGCCHHILKMFDFWPHLLLTACQKFWLVLFIYKLFLDRGRTSEREPDFHISRRFLPLFSM